MPSRRWTRVPAEAWATLPDRMSGGVCILDVDGRAPLDLFFAMRPSAAGGSRLYVGRGPLDYVDEAVGRGLGDVGDAFGCLAFDMEGDGDDDLLVTGLGSLRLFENRSGHFSDVSARLGLTLDPRDIYASAAAGDLDGDGDLDLVVAGDLRYDPDLIDPSMCITEGCGADVSFFAPIPNLLLIRQAGGGYTRGEAALAPDLLTPEPTLVVSISDLDGDGRSEIFVGNDFGWAYFDRPLRADAGGVYRDASTQLGLAYNRRGWGGCTMGFANGDLDRDGRLDHVATSFAGDATAVFLCADDGWCADRGVQMGMDATATSFRWGAGLADLDLDGWLDLVEATGNLYTGDEAAMLGFMAPRDQRPNVLRNMGGELLLPVEPTGPTDALAQAHSARGLALGDLDDDGRVDVVLAPSIGSPVLLHNVTPRAGHWLRVVLRGRGANPGAVGATVTVQTDAGPIIHQRIAGEGYAGSFDPRLHFGVASPAPVPLEVRWPGGEVTRRADVALDLEITVAEP